MGAVTTCPGFLDALRTALDARAGMNGVSLYTGPMSEGSLGTECCIFAVTEVSAGYDYETMAQIETSEQYDIEGRIWIVKPGGDETVIKAARDRAFAILEDVHDYLSTLNTTAATVAALTVERVKLTGWTMEQLAVDGGRDCRIRFTLHVRTHFTPTA